VALMMEISAWILPCSFHLGIICKPYPAIGFRSSMSIKLCYIYVLNLAWNNRVHMYWVKCGWSYAIRTTCLKLFFMVFLLVCFFPRGIECISSVLSFVFVYRLVIVDYLAVVTSQRWKRRLVGAAGGGWGKHGGNSRFCILLPSYLWRNLLESRN
jgi:hypothetical protein